MALRFSVDNRLFWKILTTYFILLIALCLGYLFCTSLITDKYFQQINQVLYGDIASHLVGQVRPLKNGKPDTLVTHDIIHSTMIINPSLEVYLLNKNGQIIDYALPDKSIKLKQIDLGPIKRFIASDHKSFILGDDPRHPLRHNVFSAAPIYEGSELTGYAYIILSSEAEARVMAFSSKSFIIQLGTAIFLIALFLALLGGAITFWLYTRSFRQIVSVVERFKKGDLHARVEGRTRGSLSVLATTFNGMADAIVDHADKMKSMDLLRKELIANVSHDLRTPLSIMQGYIETLLMKAQSISPREREKYLNVILASTQKLSHLVSQLFEYSKLEARQVTAVKEAFFLNELVSDILIQFQILAEKQGVHLKLEASENLPMVFADIALVERVIQNLLDNALKFSRHKGNITVRLENKAEGVEVCIADDGMGISKKDQPYIFERYKQFPNLKSGNKGLGLGLAIVKKILEIHQTDIFVQSDAEKGASFRFQLPVFNPRQSLNHSKQILFS